MNYCPNEGYLVDGDIQLPPDPIDYDVPGLPIRGCNRLRCPNCKALVRNAPAFKFESFFPKVNLAELYEVSDLGTSPLMKKQEGLRFYLCRCHYWSQSSSADPLRDPDPDAFAASMPPWECDGHPIVELPRNIDGVEVTPANVGELTAQSLHGITPPGAARQDKWGSGWAERLHARLAKTPWQDLVVTAASACMEDPNAEVRARALHFFFGRQLPAGAQRAVELLDGKRALFAGVPDKVARPSYKNPTLEHTLWLIAGPLVSQPGRARELARADALTPGKANHPLYFMLADGDPDWVVEHIDALTQANPGEVKFLSDAIRYRLPKRIPKQPILERLQSLAPASGAK